MKIKTLQAMANSICQMACSARVNSSLELLGDLPDDIVEIDLLTGSCRHPQKGLVDIPMVKDFREWLRVMDRKDKLQFDHKSIRPNAPINFR
jgi:hypothetical protein